MRRLGMFRFSVLMLIGAYGWACNKPADPERAPPNIAAPAPTTAREQTDEVEVVWFEGTLEAALNRAKVTGKLVFVDVGAYWCPPCHRLAEETFVAPDVVTRLTRDYVAVPVDAEKGEGPRVVEQYHVQAYPTLLVLDATGVERGRIVDFVTADELIARLDRIAAGGTGLESLATAVEHNPDDLARRYDYALGLALAAKRELAEREYQTLLVADPHNELGYAAKVLHDRAFYFVYKLDEDRDGAIAAFRQLQQRFPDAKESIHAHRQIGRVLNDRGQPDLAIAELDEMVARDPENVDLKISYGWFSFRERCRPEAGLAMVERGLEQAPQSAELWYLAYELAKLVGDMTKARTAIGHAARIEPDNRFYRRQRATVEPRP